MKTLYIECKMGAAGDMLLAALYELLEPDKQQEFLSIMNQLFAPDISFHPESKTQCGISGTHMRVNIFGAEEHTFYHKHHHHPAPASVDVVTTGHVHTRGLGAAQSTDITEEPHEHHSHEEHSHEHHSHEHAHHHHSHEHYSYINILEKIQALPLPKDVRNDAEQIYKIIGEAEAKVHNSSLEHIHFHEVGSLDALADVVGNCLLLSSLDVEQIIVSPIHVGNGTVHCAHSILPVPAPATAEILKNIPYYTGDIDSELCTPTGAAILKYFATGFGPMPIMSVLKSGFGLGTKEFPTANGLRAFYGETDYFSLYHTNALTEKGICTSTQDTILELSCNLDDITGEELGFAMELLLDAGALDVYYTSIQMKKNRPGILLSCLCNLDEKEKFTELIFRNTTTRGIRYQIYSRSKLEYSLEEIKTNYGPITKKANYGYGIEKSKYEYEDLRKIAIKENVSIRELSQQLTKLETN